MLHYMMTRRKKKDWPTIGRGKQPDEVHEAVKLDAEDWPHVDAIYEELQIASDNFAATKKLSKKFAREFAKRTGKVIPPMLLAAAVICRRKSARLATLKPRSTQDDLGFSDIDKLPSEWRANVMMNVGYNEFALASRSPRFRFTLIVLDGNEMRRFPAPTNPCHRLTPASTVFSRLPG